MPYITIQQAPIYYQMSFDDILDGSVDLSRMVTSNVTNTRTHYREHLRESFLKQFNFEAMIETLKQFNQQHEKLFEVKRETLYNKFFIPKNSGGLREINAPLPELMDALRQLKTILETNMPASYHTSAFAYVKGRCTVDCIKRHQQNESRWFVKLDFSNFFGSTTEEFVMSMFSMIFPFSEIVKQKDGLDALKRALSLCFLNGGLPQGTPISPTITNIMMIPIDHYLCNKLRDFECGRKCETIQKMSFVYTRYADDILISSKYHFNPQEISDFVISVLSKFNAPFRLKEEKTRYGSSAGSNWNLGLMLNVNNEITIGFRKKKLFRAMCCNYILDKKKNISWDLHDVQVFSGLISYYRMIERKYIDHVIEQNNSKFGVDLESLIRDDLNQ